MMFLTVTFPLHRLQKCISAFPLRCKFVRLSKSLQNNQARNVVCWGSACHMSHYVMLHLTVWFHLVHAVAFLDLLALASSTAAFTLMPLFPVLLHFLCIVDHEPLHNKTEWILACFCSHTKLCCSLILGGPTTFTGCGWSTFWVLPQLTLRPYIQQWLQDAWGIPWW